jgi:S-adenosylmethionine:tRNA ribosyltransferase-isomerase
MIPAVRPVRRRPEARLLTVDGSGNIGHGKRTDFLRLLRPGDLLIANDAATLPASLSGLHSATGRQIEVRLAGRQSIEPRAVKFFNAILFGEGDFRMRTEDRPLPHPITPGDRLKLGPLRATVLSLLGHPRLVSLRFDGSPDVIRAGLAMHGRPIQYSHVLQPLALWDVWTSIAGPPVAFEPPSAGFVLDWSLLRGLKARGVHFATITHAAGISSTGDPALDEVLPFDEPYRIPQSTAWAIRQVRACGGRIIAVGTTVVRALEHAAEFDGVVNAGWDIATQRISAASRLRVVDAILSGTHEQGTSHYELLRAFADDDVLQRADEEMTVRDYRTHEFGDSVFIESKNSPALAAHGPAAA